MSYVITELCIRDGSCVEVCPVACIHTTPEAPQFYIDPDICIECEQCVVVCPVEAVFLDIELPDQYLKAEEDNDGQGRVLSKCTHCNMCMPTIYSHTHCVVTGAPDSLVS